MLPCLRVLARFALSFTLSWVDISFVCLNNVFCDSLGLVCPTLLRLFVQASVCDSLWSFCSMSLCLCVFEQSFVLVMGSLSKVVAFACSSRLLFGFG